MQFMISKEMCHLVLPLGAISPKELSGEASWHCEAYQKKTLRNRGLKLHVQHRQLHYIYTGTILDVIFDVTQLNSQQFGTIVDTM